MQEVLGTHEEYVKKLQPLKQQTVKWRNHPDKRPQKKLMKCQMKIRPRYKTMSDIRENKP